MIIFKNPNQISEYINRQKQEGKQIGFVPTMGALHQGHLSLIEVSKKKSDLTVCSIFINPTQFNNPEDFKFYPKTIEKDIEKLVTAHCDLLFLPAVTDIYIPNRQKKHYPLGKIENILEGYYRPGHFQGVCQVVDRLLEIIQPHNLYLGQKDFQQCMVIKKLINILGKENEFNIIIVPTVREADGLAMSSRNLRLNDDQRKSALLISRELSRIKENLKTSSLEQLKLSAIEHLKRENFSVDYVEIVNATDLTPATETDKPLVALAAASIGNIRLIDNLLLN